MTALPRSTRPSRAARGAAMTEMVLALPTLALVLALIFIFGFNTERLVKSAAVPTEEARRASQGLAGPGTDYDNAGLPQGDHENLDNAWFADDPGQLTVRTVRTPLSAAEEHWLRTTAAVSEEAAALMQQQFDRFPAAVRVTAEVNHDGDSSLADRFAGPITRQHTVIHSGWRRADHTLDLGPGPWGTWYRTAGIDVSDLVSEQYFDEFTSSIRGRAESGNPYAGAVLDWLESPIRYRGPSIFRSGSN